MFSDAGRMINQGNVSAWRKEGWRGSALGEWIAQPGRPHAFPSLFLGTLRISSKLRCQEWFLLLLLFGSQSNSFSVVWCRGGGGRGVLLERGQEGQRRTKKDTRTEARRNRRMHFRDPLFSLSGSLGPVILSLFTCRAGLPGKRSINVRGYGGVIGGVAMIIFGQGTREYTNPGLVQLFHDLPQKDVCKSN